MRRGCGIFFGVATHALFAFTVWHLVWFLKGPTPLVDAGLGAHADGGGALAVAGRSLCIDALLAVVFAVPHSVLLLPAVRKRLVAAGIAGPFYGCFFCVATCLTLLVTILAWQPITLVVWRWPEPVGTLVAWAFVASWAALFYSLSLTGLGWQTGWTPWWRWVRGQRPPPRPFVVRGAYRFLRHPVYLSFLGLVWFVPVVTLDRAVLIAVWTVYIFAGSVLKDRRLLFFIGEEYRSYQSEVPGYPGVPMGPLARIPLSSVSPPSVSLPAMIPTTS